MFDLFPYRLAQSYIADRLREAEKARSLANVPSRGGDRVVLAGVIRLVSSVVASARKGRVASRHDRPPHSCSCDRAMSCGQPPTRYSHESPVADQPRDETARSVVRVASAARTTNATA